MHGRQRAWPVGKALGHARARWERVGHVSQRVPSATHEREDLSRAHALAGRVVRDLGALAAAMDGSAVRVKPALARVGLGLSAGERAAAERVVRDAEAAARLGLAVQQQLGAGRIALHEPGLVEEHRAHGSGGVVDARFDERPHPAPAHRSRTDRAHLDRNRRLLPDRERGYGARLAAVAGQVLEQRAHRQQAERRQALSHLSRRQLQRLEQSRGARPQDRRSDHRAARERARGGEREGAAWRRARSARALLRRRLL